jgi:hypothetical protein
VSGAAGAGSTVQVVENGGGKVNILNLKICLCSTDIKLLRQNKEVQ